MPISTVCCRSLQVAAKAHAAAVAAAEKARNATEYRAGGYGQGSFPGTLPHNRTAGGNVTIPAGNPQSTLQKVCRTFFITQLRLLFSQIPHADNGVAERFEAATIASYWPASHLGLSLLAALLCTGSRTAKSNITILAHNQRHPIPASARSKAQGTPSEWPAPDTGCRSDFPFSLLQELQPRSQLNFSDPASLPAAVRQANAAQLAASGFIPSSAGQARPLPDSVPSSAVPCTAGPA